MDTADVIQLLTTDNNLYLATDGGTALGIGYFGWVLATVMETIIKAKGHATGTPSSMDSLRTESISLLSILTYLH